MVALCREHRLEHRRKHIALRYFLARELQQRGQLRLAYVASEANTADIFTKALAPGDHQRFCTLLGFPTFTDLITHLRTSDTRYRAALPAEFCAKNPPPMYITLYYVVTRLSDTLRSLRNHFLSLCPTTLTVDLIEERLLAAETSITAVGASRGDPRTPFFEGCSPVPLLPSVASPAAVDLVGTESVSAASTPSERRRNGKGKRGKGTGGGGGGGGSGGGGGGRGGGGGGGRGGGVGGSSGGGGSGGGGGWGGGGGGAGRGGAVQRGPQHQSRSRETPSPQQLREWFAGRQGSGGAGPCTYVLHTGDRTGEQCGGLHATQRCFSRLTDAWRSQFPDATKIPHWGDLLKSGVAIFDLDFDAILAAMYAVSISAEGDCYVCVPPDPGIEATALGASESAAPGARESAAPVRTTLTPLSRPVAVSLADPSGGPVLARYSTVLPCPAAPSGSLSGLYLPLFSTNLVSGADLQDGGVDQFTPARQRVTHCTCAQTGRHLATFTRGQGSSLYTLTTESPPVAASGQVAASCQVFAAASRSGPESAPCSCRLQSHHTLLWHHRLGHPSLPRLRGMASCVLVSGLPRSLPPLPPGPAPTCVPCVEGRQRAAPHSSEFPPTEAPLQTLHMDVWGPARVRGQVHERYFLLVVDDYSRYTTVFPLRRKGERWRVFLRPSASLLSCGGHPPDVHASGLSLGQLVTGVGTLRSPSVTTLRSSAVGGRPSLRALGQVPAPDPGCAGLPWSLPPLPPGPAPTCVPCVEGRQRAAPHSSEFPPTEAPLQTLHMDVWGPARVRGQGHERYFLLVVDDYSCYTIVFPLRRKDEVTEVLIDWIRVARLQLRERFGSDFPVPRLHSDRVGEFSSDLLRAFCRAEGIRQTFTLPASPQQNEIAERCIGMVMDVARMSMIHAAPPHFLWPFAVQYAVHQINLQPQVSLPETSPTLRWTGKVGDAFAFLVEVAADSGASRAWGCWVYVC
ncbi:unnamed protein product [Closterium sp. NIES-54]